MTVLSATPSLTATRAAAASATPAPAPAADPAMGSLFQADLARASQAAATSSDTAKVKETAQEKSISLVYRGSKSGVLSPPQQFEAFVLRSFVESMQPQENSEYFGTGTAGKIWKSMLAEQIGDEMAKDGGIGIADMLEKRGARSTALDSAQQDMKRSESLSTGAQAFKGLGPI